MEKKPVFYLADTGKEVTYGDVIRSHMKCENGVSQTTSITLNLETVPILIQLGILKPAPLSNTLDMGISISDVINRLATRLGWKPQRVERYLNGIDTIMPMAAFNIVIRELAIIIDGKYPDHINNSEKIYCISSLDGRIHEVCRAHIKNFRNFAAFRTLEDARLACRILREPLKQMFSGKKQESKECNSN